MFFKKFFVGVLLVFGLNTSVIYAESELNEYVSNLGEMALAPSALKTLFDQINASDTANSTNIASLANAIQQIKAKKTISARQHVLRNNNPYLSIDLMKTSDTQLRQLRSQHYKNIQYNNQWAEHIATYIGTPLEVISVLTSAYSLVTRDYESLPPLESAALGIQDALSLGTGIASISQKVYSAVPTKAYTRFLSQNPVSKALLRVDKLAAVNVLSTVILGAQIQSAVYQHYRDTAISEIKDNLFSMSLTQKNSRNAKVKKLSELLVKHYFDETTISHGEISSILQNHSVMRPNYSALLGAVGRSGNGVVLTYVFRDFAESGSKYMRENFTKSDFSTLTNTEKIYMALDAIAYIAAIEDDEVYQYMLEEVDSGAKVADVIFGSLEGSSIYKVFNTTDLRNKMFPYLINRESAYDFYGDIYKIIANGMLAEAELKQRAELGQIVADLRKKREEQYLEDIQKIVFEVPQGSIASWNMINTDVGNTITFYPYINENSLRECAAIPYDTLNPREFFDDNDQLLTLDGESALYRLWYYDMLLDDGVKKSVTLSYDHTTGHFTFAMPAGQIYMVSMDIAHKEYLRYNIGCGLPGDIENYVYKETGGSSGGENNATHPLKKTGQTTSYTAGDDGSYQAGVTPSYTRSASGVVTDHVTNLEWQDDYSDNGGSIKSADWQGAIDYCSGLGLNGGGWRLPSIEELETIVGSSRYNPSIDTTVFARISSSYYWSSTTSASRTSSAWRVNFNYGYSSNFNKTYSYYVRCVRGGQ